VDSARKNMFVKGEISDNIVKYKRDAEVFAIALLLSVFFPQMF